MSKCKVWVRVVLVLKDVLARTGVRLQVMAVRGRMRSGRCSVQRRGCMKTGEVVFAVMVGMERVPGWTAGQVLLHVVATVHGCGSARRLQSVGSVVGNRYAWIQLMALLRRAGWHLPLVWVVVALQLAAHLGLGVGQPIPKAGMVGKTGCLLRASQGVLFRVACLRLDQALGRVGYLRAG